MTERDYIRPSAEPRSHKPTPARTAMIKSVYGQACPSGDAVERALMAIFDALTPDQRHIALTQLGWVGEHMTSGVTPAAPMPLVRRLSDKEIEQIAGRDELTGDAILDFAHRLLNVACGVGVPGHQTLSPAGTDDGSGSPPEA
jgi:hypothetical protein